MALRHKRDAKHAERYKWIELLLQSLSLRFKQEDVQKIDKLARSLDPKGIENFVKEDRLFRWFDEHQN